jgi:hypothetical protein
LQKARALNTAWRQPDGAGVIQNKKPTGRRPAGDSQTITEAKVMKSEKAIRQQIAEIQQQAERLRTTLQPLEKKRMGVELKFLRQALMVAEAGVTMADLQRDLEALKKRRDAIRDGFSQWLANTPYKGGLKQMEATYNREAGLAEVVVKIKFLQRCVDL